MSCTQRLHFVLSATSLLVLSSGIFSGCAMISSEEKEKPQEISQEAQTLLDEAEQLMFLMRFKEAMTKVDQVLAMHPDSRPALTMVFRIRLAELDNDAFIAGRQREESHARASREALRKGILPDEKPPLDRATIQLKPGITQEEELKVKEKLQRKVSHMDLQDTDLDKVLFEIFKEAEINIALDPGNFAGKKFTIRGKDMTVRYVLENIARTQGLNFTVDDENVWIVSSDKPVFITRVFRLNTGITRIDTRGGYEGLGTLGILGQTVKSSGGGMTGGGAGGAGGGGGGFGGGGGGMGGAGNSGQDKEKEKTHIEQLIEKIPTLVPSWPEDSQLYLDKKQNLVIVKSTREAVEEVDKLLKVADEVPRQVNIEARFVQIQGEENFDFGVSWDFPEVVDADGNVPADYVLTPGSHPDPSVNPSDVVPNRWQQFKDSKTEFGDLVGPTGDSGRGGTLSLKGVFGDRPFRAILSAFEKTSFVSTVSVPSVTVSNNNTATIGVTTNYPFVEEYEVSNVGTGLSGSFSQNVTTTPVVTAQLNDENFLGRALVVTPSIGADGKTVTLYIQPVIRALAGPDLEIADSVLIPTSTGSVTIPVLKRPIFETKIITTQVSIQDGETVVVGGLITDEASKGEQKVPFLGDLPLLGSLFRRKENYTSKVNLYIFITARIMSPDGSTYQ